MQDGDVIVGQVAEAEDVYVFPASLEQHRYWILNQVEENSTASNMAIAFRLEGELHDSVVEKCISALTLRHEALRTTFRMVDGELLQVISEEPLYGFTVSDLRELPENERHQQAENLIREHSHSAVDLAAGPLFIVRLIHINDREHFLAFTIHHIVCDGWSNGILVRDFGALYAALSRGLDPGLPELPFQFADFTEWQKEWLQSDAAQSALEFWKAQIQRNMPAVDLPTDRPRNAHQDGPGDIESKLFSPALHSRLKDYCRRHQATMHQVLLAGFEAFLSRYTGQAEFLLGSSIANRTQAGMEDVVGRFANPQVILADVAGNPSFRQLVDRVIDWSTLAYAHQDLPFSRLMEEFQLELSGATSQFLQVYFVYQKAFMQPQQAGDLRIIPRPSVSGGVNFDLLVSIVERSEGPRLQIEYNTELFDRERISSFIEQYIRTLDAVMENDTLTVSVLPLVSPEEQIALYDGGRGDIFPEDRPESLLRAFDQQVASRGGTAAVIAGDQRISWTALQQRSHEFAAGLERLGVQAGQFVALRVEPGSDTAAAALAIMRRGAVVLPVPVTATKEEWSRIKTELQPRLSLASDAFSRTLSEISSFGDIKSPTGISVATAYPAATDQAWCGLRIDSSDKFEVSCASHSSTVENLLAVARTLNLHAGDSVLVVPAETSSDAWTDLMLPLISGASIVYLESPSRVSLQALLDEEKISCAFATGREWLAVLKSGWKGDRRTQLICRGDRLPASVAKQLVQSGRIWSLLSSPSVAGPVGLASISEGTGSQWPIAPLPSQRLIVLDIWDNPVPPGVVGELAVGKKDTVVRTGYLGRYSPRWGFEVVESLPRSVRLHGYQLKLGEVEDRLLSHPSVAKAKASIQNGPHGEAALVAYVTGNEGALPAIAPLTEYLRSTAPGHLACAQLIPVPAIPCRLDGSPDLASLPQAGSASYERPVSAEFVPPRDEIESRLVKIWEEVLGTQGIGVRTNFFSLGGYSLLIVRLFARINKAMGSSLPITTIFNAPTIEQLADILRGRSEYSCLVPVQPGKDKPPFFIIHSYLLYAGLPSVLGESYPFYGLREMDTDAPMTLQERVASYIQAMRSIQPTGPYYIGGWCAAGPLAVEAARQLIEAGEQVGTVVLFDSWRPGYVEELATRQSNDTNRSMTSSISRKYEFHAAKMRSMSLRGKLKYLRLALGHKLARTRDALYQKHWALAGWLSRRFGIALPDFMHNISLDTLNSIRQFRIDPFTCRFTLIRAMEEPDIPGSSVHCGWGDVATQGVEVLWSPGNHESMFKEPQLSIVGKMFRECLEKARQRYA
jgi:non-ribosomal peptide synthetase component F/thioesterase domain-containing protein